MTSLERRLAKISAHQGDVFRLRNAMVQHLDFCPAEAVNTVLGNIDKADRELRRLARVRRVIEKQINEGE